MTLLIVGNELQLAEIREKFGAVHEYIATTDDAVTKELVGRADVVFDFANAWTEERRRFYTQHPSVPIFLHTVTRTLRQLVGWEDQQAPSKIFGFNGLPTFVNRPRMEVSMLTGGDVAALEAICRALNTEFSVVKDSIGMVTPRVISMIINEAYLTAAEDTASRADIDLAMKLGTNYPFGPFEWATRIGLRNVVALLEAIYADTGDDRYRICPLILADANATILSK